MHEGWGGRRHACSTCASPSGTTLSSVENTVHRHRFTQYYHNLQLKIRSVLGAVLDAWIVVRCWVLKSILQEHKKQGRLTDSDRNLYPGVNLAFPCGAKLGQADFPHSKSGKKNFTRSKFRVRIFNFPPSPPGKVIYI